jgi:hypothetical protein
VLADADVDTVVTRARVLLATAELSEKPSEVVFVRSISPVKNAAELRRKARQTTVPPLRSDVPVLGGAIVFTKRVLRRLLRWLIEPPWRQQRKFNAALVRATLRLAADQEKLRRDHEALQLEIAELRSQSSAPRTADESDARAT